MRAVTRIKGLIRQHALDHAPEPLEVLSTPLLSCEVSFEPSRRFQAHDSVVRRLEGIETRVFRQPLFLACLAKRASRVSAFGIFMLNGKPW